MYDLRHVVTPFDMQQYMHVIRHHTPRVQRVPRAVKVPQRIGDELSVLAQQTRAGTGIELTIQTQSESLVESRALGRGGAQAQGEVAFQEELSRSVRGKRVTQTKGDEVDRVVYAPVRHAAAGAVVDDSSFGDEIVVTQFGRCGEEGVPRK